MSNYRKLLEKELEAEIDYILVNYFVRFIAKKNKYLYQEGLIKELKEHKPNLRIIKQYTGMEMYNCNEGYLFYLLTEPYNSKKGTYDRKSLIKNAVLLKYFLTGEATKRKETAMEILMGLHCGNYQNLIVSPEGKETLSTLNDFDTKLASKEFHFDHITATRFLKYYYQHSNKVIDPDYKDLLTKYAQDMEQFLEFYGLSDIDYDNLDQFSDYQADKSNYNLISFFFNQELPSTRNKHYNLEKIKTSLATAPNRKEMLIASLSVFDITDEIVDQFKGIELTYDDLKEFILKYEASENILTPKQIERLLINFRKYYFYSHNERELYQREVNYIISSYYEYCHNNYVHTPNQFIEYFNRHNDFSLSHFSFVGNEPLNKRIFNEIINSIPASIRYFTDTKSVQNYINTTDINPQDNSDTKRYIKDTYYDLLDGYMIVKTITFDYFVEKYVLEEDREDFMDLVNWYCTKNGCDTKTSESAKERTAKILYVDMSNELSSNPLKDRRKITEKYKRIIERNDLEEYLPISLQSHIRRITANRMKEITPEFIRDFNEAINNNTNPYLVLLKYGLRNMDASSILRSVYDSSDKYRQCEQLITNGMRKYQKELYEKRKETTEQKRQAILADYASSTLDLRDFATDNNIDYKVMLSWINNGDNEDEVISKCRDKVLAEKEAMDSQYHLDNIESIVFGINNGVESVNTVRAFTFFDLLMLQDKPIPLDKAERILTDKKMRQVPGYSYINTRKFIGRTRGIDDKPIFAENYDDVVGSNYFVSNILNLEMTVSTEAGPRKVTAEEKQYVLDFIDEMGYPKKVFLDALVAHAKGEYNFEEKRKAVVNKKTNN